MKILLTGATGFLGSYLLKALTKKGHDVSIIKRSFSDTWRIKNKIEKTKVYDIDKVGIEEIFEQDCFDGIIHTAALYRRNSEAFLESVKANVLMPLSLLDCAIKNKVKMFVNTDTTLPCVDDDDVRNYVVSKKQFLQWFKLCYQKIRAINISMDYLYGPYENKKKFIPFVIDECAKNVPSIDLTKCFQKRGFVYIDDAVDAYMKILRVERKVKTFDFVCYEVGTGKTESLKEVALTIKKIFNADTKLNFGAIPNRKGEPKEIKTNPQKLFSLGWKPKFSLRDGITKIKKEEYRR
jgi:nucleoside-diphosphate-sugar epimerase